MQINIQTGHIQSMNQTRSNVITQREPAHNVEQTVQSNTVILDNRESTAQLRRLASTIDSGPRMAMQFQTAAMMNGSPRTNALNTQAALMRNAPAQQKLKEAEHQLLQERIPEGVPPIQAVWKNSDVFKGGILEWDAVMDGLKWYYDTAEGKYFYIMDHASASEDMTSEDDGKLMDGHPVSFLADERVPPEIVVTTTDNKNETHITDPLGRACLRAISQVDYAILIPALAAELKADKPNGQGMDDMAKGVLRETKNYMEPKEWTWNDDETKWGKGDTYVTCDDGMGIYRSSGEAGPQLVVACRRAIFKQIGLRMQDENGFPEAEAGWSVGLQRDVVNVKGIALHFTNRTRESDIDNVRDMTAGLIDLIVNVNPGKWAKTIIEGLGVTMSATLKNIESTTRVAQDERTRTGVVSELNTEGTAEHVKKLCEATKKRWCAALNGNIHIVIDRAEIQDTDGSNAYNKNATPQNLMGDTGIGLDVEQRISINLDSAPIDQVVLTIAHELGHAIGFNPTDIDSMGHFKDIEEYKDAEESLGPKLLYDAYFFEAMVELLLEGR